MFIRFCMFLSKHNFFIFLYPAKQKIHFLCYLCLYLTVCNIQYNKLLYKVLFCRAATPREQLMYEWGVIHNLANNIRGHKWGPQGPRGEMSALSLSVVLWIIFAVQKWNNMKHQIRKGQRHICVSENVFIRFLAK